MSSSMKCKLFFDRLEKFQDQVAFIFENEAFTYGQLTKLANEFTIQHSLDSGLIAIECQNQIQPFIAYISALRARVPVMLLPKQSLSNDEIIKIYQPTHIYRKKTGDWQIEKTSYKTKPNSELAVMLSTSGSTGSAKFVKLSYDNIHANAESIAEYLEITHNDRSMTSLPFHYSYGLSVINSHLLSGASFVLTDKSVSEELFWEELATYKVTNLAGVPYTFELFERINFESKDIQSIRFITQAGGRLHPDKVRIFQKVSENHDFKLYIMYGQTEATARMAYMPPNMLTNNMSCIGIPIPGGYFWLIDENGNRITDNDVAGELVYTGPNVMMGYAESVTDLSTGKEVYELQTGDIAAINTNGMYYIVGRKKRFIKLFGVRTNLDELENRLREYSLAVTCTGTDENLVLATTGGKSDATNLASDMLNIPISAIKAVNYNEIPLLPSGKISYQKIINDAEKSSPREKENNLKAALQGILLVTKIHDNDTFVSLGGDSLSYVEASTIIEDILGYLPDDWQNRTVRELELVNSRSKKNRFGAVDSASVLRAIAILTIVSGHFDLFNLGGGAYLLLAVAGYNFARFQLPQILNNGTSTVLKSIMIRIVAPTFLYLIALYTFLGEFHLSGVLMISNFFGPHSTGGLSYWFLEVLIQIYIIVFAVFSIKRIRAYLFTNPYNTLLSLFILSYALNFFGPYVWDTEYLYNRVPHMLLYMFMMGALIAFSKGTIQKVITNILIFLILSAYLLNGAADGLDYLFVGSMCLLWIKNIYAPRFVIPVITAMASASLFIYLSHFQSKSIIGKLIESPPPALSVFIAIVGGVVFWKVWGKGYDLYTRVVKFYK